MTGNELVKKLSREYKIPEDKVIEKILAYFHVIGSTDRIMWDRKNNKYVYSEEYKRMMLEI